MLTDPAQPLPRPSPDWALFLDVDGTLLDIAERPDAVEIPAGMGDLLERLLHGLDGALALVSGRPIETLDRFFHPLRLPAAGLHGLERRMPDGGRVESPLDPRRLDPARALLAGVARRIAGVLLEDKGRTLALHYRQATDREQEVRRAAREAASTAGDDYELLEGKRVIELRPRGAGKDKVVEAFVREPPFAGRRPVFVGDDRTDEDGFVAVNRLGGHSIRVGAHGPSAAHWRVADAPSLRAWLAEIAGELEAARSSRLAGR